MISNHPLSMLPILCLLWSVSPPPASPLRTSGDDLVHRVFLPSARNVHGELRWIRREDGWALQTLLYTPRLRRGLQRIRKQELFAWPPGSLGYEDSQLYLQQLEAAADIVLARAQASGKEPQLLIEYVWSPAGAGWGLWQVEMTHDADQVTITSRTAITVQAASPHYVRRAMRIQTEQGFGAAPPELVAE
jgi:hypothetical protein